MAFRIGDSVNLVVANNLIDFTDATTGKLVATARGNFINRQ